MYYPCDDVGRIATVQVPVIVSCCEVCEITEWACETIEREEQYEEYMQKEKDLRYWWYQ